MKLISLYFSEKTETRGTKIQDLFDPQMSSRNQNKLLLFPRSLLLKPETSHKVHSAVEEPSLISNPSPRPPWTNTVRLCPNVVFEMRQQSLGSSAAWLSSERRDLKSRQLPTWPSPASTQDVLFCTSYQISGSGLTSIKESSNKNLKAWSSVKGFFLFALVLCAAFVFGFSCNEHGRCFWPSHLCSHSLLCLIFLVIII